MAIGLPRDEIDNAIYFTSFYTIPLSLAYVVALMLAFSGTNSMAIVADTDDKNEEWIVPEQEEMSLGLCEDGRCRLAHHHGHLLCHDGDD